MKDILILGIETSCDDTSAAVFKNGKPISFSVESQGIHKGYGGVVPELASRAHMAKIVPVIQNALSEANISLSELSAVAYTQGPGLLGSLLVGSSFARTFALSLGIPAIPVHHMQAHIHALFIQEKENDYVPSLPFICLTVSGGHTQLVRVNGFFDMEILGETLDDAAGEAFDKTGKMLGLSYPAGPEIERLSKEGNKDRFTFPIPQVPGYNFSFSGFKTSVMNFLQKETQQNPNFINDNLNDLCASIQNGIVKILVDKTIKVLNDTGILELGLAGGVSANSALRKAMEELPELKSGRAFFPKIKYCTDNGSMIAMTGHFALKENLLSPQSFSAKARMDFFQK